MSSINPVLAQLPRSSTIGRMSYVVNATISSSTALSDAIDKIGLVGGSIQFPAAWTAASLAFQVSNDGSNFYPLKDQSGNLVELSSLPTSAGEGRSLPDDLWAFQYFKLWSETSGSNVNQSSDRIFVVNLVG